MNRESLIHSNSILVSKTNKLLIPFFTAGYPELGSTIDIIESFDKVGADYIEIGLAHSDALADGVIIQKASHQALLNGINISHLFEQVKHTKNNIQKSKLILFSYYNPIWTFGLKETVTQWKEAGGYALLIPDLPLEESAELLSLCKEVGLKLIFLIAPTSTKERIKTIAEMSEEFIYLVSVTGVTGVRNKASTNLNEIIKQIKFYNPNIPVVIGFGISGVVQAKEAIEQGADGVVLGSSLIQILEQKNGINQACNLLLEVKEALA